MSNETTPERDPHSGTETTGHVWDGIKELNTPLPRWWLIVWYMTIAWAIVYMILMPAIPALPGQGTNTLGVRGESDRHNVAVAVSKLKDARQSQSATLLNASLEQIETDRDLQQFALAMGESLFGDNCATCHGAGGRGAKGYPTLADDVWLWDGTLEGIQYTVTNGIRQENKDATRLSAMPAFGRDKILTGPEIGDVVQYVLTFSNRAENVEAAARGAATFQSQCAVCHTAAGTGDRKIGAPDLTDAEWLYGGDPKDIYATVHSARNSHMPAWEDRLDEASIKALSVYVHSLGGGE